MADKKIGIIDDETMVMKFYKRDIRKLDLNFKVKLISGVKDGIAWIRENKDDIFVLVVDTMLPPEGEFSMEETNKGILTGVRFVEKIRNELEYSGLIYVLTNLKAEEAYREYKNDECCRILSKRKCSSKEFARIVASYHKEQESNDE